MKVLGLFMTCSGALMAITAWVLATRSEIFTAVGTAGFVIGMALLIWKGSVEKVKDD